MKKLLILSGKGGTGKTTISAALIKLSQAQAVADCDVDAPNLHLLMGQTASPRETDFMGGDKAVVDSTRCIGCAKCAAYCRFDAIRMVAGKAVVNEFACEGCGVCSYLCHVGAVSLCQDMAGTCMLYQGNVSVFSTATLKMGRGNSGKLVAEVKQAMAKAAPACPIAILDGSPGIGCPVIASVSGVDLVLVVAEPSHSGISDLKRLVKTVESFRTAMAVCVNKYDTCPDCAAEIEAFCCANDISFVGRIPFDSAAVRAVNTGATIVDVPCVSGTAVRDIYQSILALLETSKH